MMTAQYVDQELDFDVVSAPIEGETLATVSGVADAMWWDQSWREFQAACTVAATRHSSDLTVDPNIVRELLTHNGELSITPKRYAAFWAKATSKSGFLVNCGWTTNTDTAGGNAGKPIRLRRLRSHA